MKGGERVYHGSGPKVDLDIKVYIIYLIRRLINQKTSRYFAGAGTELFVSNSATFTANGEPGFSLT